MRMILHTHPIMRVVNLSTGKFELGYGGHVGKHCPSKIDEVVPLSEVHEERFVGALIYLAVTRAAGN